MTPRPPLTTTITTAVVVAVAALPLSDVFDGWSWAISVLGAVGAAAVVASLIETFAPRLPASILVGTTVAGALVWALMVSLRDVFWDDPISRSMRRELGDGVFSGWGALLEEQFPLTDPQSAETFAALLTWIAAAAGVHVAARYRTVLAGVGTAAAVLWIATAAALPRGLTPALFGAGAGGAALLAVATTTRSKDQGWRVGRAVALLLMIIGAGAVATIAANSADRVANDPFDPRASRNDENVVEEVTDLLAEYGVAREEGEVVLTLDGPPIGAPLRLRLQVYDTHDGERWLPATGFQDVASFPTPEILPPGEVVSYRVDLDFLPGSWIPLPDRLMSIDIEDLRWNDETQTALETRVVDTYEFTGTNLSRAGLEGLDAERDAVSALVSEVPAGLPEEIRAAAETAAEGTADALAAIDAITARVRELGRDERVPPGNSFGRLRIDLTQGRPTGAEQIASLHALMLRAVGIPSRVVVGYVATDAVVESDDLHVWTETALPGVGWVANDPVPATSEVGDEVDTDPTATTTSLAENTALQAQALPQELGPGDDPDEVAVGGNRDITVGDLLLLAAILIAAVVVIMVAVRIVRRRLRRAKGRRAEVQVLGAWAEFVDRLRELGAPVTATTTVGDVIYMARAMDERLGDEVELLGELTSISLHGPEGPDPEDGELAWEELRRIESTLASVRGGHTVALRFIDPRVLRYRAPKPPEDRDGGRRDQWRDEVTSP